MVAILEWWQVTESWCFCNCKVVFWVCESNSIQLSGELLRESVPKVCLGNIWEVNLIKEIYTLKRVNCKNVAPDLWLYKLHLDKFPNLFFVTPEKKCSIWHNLIFRHFLPNSMTLPAARLIRILDLVYMWLERSQGLTRLPKCKKSIYKVANWGIVFDKCVGSNFYALQ